MRKFEILWNEMVEQEFPIIEQLATNCIAAKGALSDNVEHYFKTHVYKRSLSCMNIVDFELVLKREASGKHRAFWFQQHDGVTLVEQFLAALRNLEKYSARMPEDLRWQWRIELRQQYLNQVLAYIIGQQLLVR